MADKLSKQPAVISQSIRETIGSGIQQNEIRIECGCIHKNDPGKIFRAFMGDGINDAHAHGLFFIFVIDNRMNHRMRSNGKIPCFTAHGSVDELELK